MNFKYAMRSMRKNPLIAAIAIVSLATGFGARTAIFSLIDQLLLRQIKNQINSPLVRICCVVFAAGPRSPGNYNCVTD